MDAVSLERILSDFKDLTSNPENFLSIKEETCSKAKSLIKNSYDFTKKHENISIQSKALAELVVDNVDLEQIWQQIELQNEEVLNENKALEIHKFVTNKNNLLFFDAPLEEDVQDESEKRDNSLSEQSEIDDSNDDDDNNDISHAIEDENKDVEIDKDDISEDNTDDDEDNSSNSDESSIDNTLEIRKQKSKKSVVDDDFFKLDEMENFLNTEEKKIGAKERNNKIDDEEDSEEESIDLFKSDDSEDKEEEEDPRLKNPRYKDFFKKQDVEKPIKRNKFLKELDKANNITNDDGDDVDKKQKSNFELREERLKQKIQEIEEQALSEKPWPLKGEITADKRPENSLLEEVLEFDVVSRPAPVITEDTTHMLEDIIIQRIKDKAFDDVEKKERFVETPLEYKKKLVLDQEKSKESLAQIYEKEYLQQKEALTSDPAQKEEEEPESHKEIRKIMQELFAELDALSNFHFTPKPPAPELKVVTNLPAIEMEEVAPVAASEAALLAPEEIKSKAKGEIIGKGERTDTDKKRERRKKKLKQKIHAKEKAKKDAMNSNSKIKNNKGNTAKIKATVTKLKNINKINGTEAKAVKSSNAFFEQLQEQVSSHIKRKANDSKLKTKKQHFDAKRMKL